VSPKEGGSYLVEQGIAQVIATLPGIELVATCETVTELERGRVERS
jgi:hypothetical protein